MSKRQKCSFSKNKSGKINAKRENKSLTQADCSIVANYSREAGMGGPEEQNWAVWRQHGTGENLSLEGYSRAASGAILGHLECILNYS